MDLIARSSYGSGDWASFQLKVMVKAQNKRIDWLKIFHKMFLKAEAAGDREWPLVAWARLEQKSSTEKKWNFGPEDGWAY